MKKIVSLLLVFSMLLGVFSITSAAGYTKPANFDEMTGLLKALEITDENFEVSDRVLTRAEFTSLVVKAGGLGAFLPETEIGAPFTDVPADSIYAKYIELAKQRGLVLGYSDNSFQPDAPVTISEATVYLIRLLGYTYIADANGGYPSGYATIASQIDLVKGLSLSTDTAVTAEMAINLIFNALNIKVLVVNSLSPEKESFTPVEGDMLMYQSFRVAKVSGVMKEMSLSALVGPNNLAPYSISVDGVQIDVGDLNLGNMFGCDVNAYYKAEEQFNTLMFIYEGRNEKEIIEINNISNVSNYTVLSLDEDGGTLRHRYMRGAAIIYNGVSTNTPFDMGMLKNSDGSKKYGTVELLDNNRDGIADVVYVNIYEEFIAGKKDVKNSILYDKNNAKNSIVLDVEVDDPYTIIYDETGEELPFNSISEDTSILVQRSLGDAYQGYIRAYVSTKTETGVLNYISEGGTEIEITVGENTYTLSPYGLKYLDRDLMGKNVTILINSLGLVSFVEINAEDAEYFGMVRMIKEARNPSDTPGIYLVNDKGKTVYYTLASNLKIDDRAKRYDLTNATDLGIVNAIFATASINTNCVTEGSDNLNTMIKYRLNKNGEVNEIDTVLNTSGALAERGDITEDDSLVMFSNFTNSQFIYDDGGPYISIDGKILIDSKTKMFCYPKEKKYDYLITHPVDEFRFTSTHTGLVVYYTKKDSITADIVTYPFEGDKGYTKENGDNFGMIVKITEAVDVDGTPHKKLYMMVGTSLKTYLCPIDLVTEEEGATPVASLKEGDIINFKLDSITGNISGILLRYKMETRERFNRYPDDNGLNMVYAYAYYSGSDGIWFVDYDPTKDVWKNETKSSYIEKYYNDPTYYTVSPYDSYTSVVVYDSSRIAGTRVYAGSKSNVIGYLEAGDTCSEIMVETYGQTYKRARTIFVIK